MTEPTPQRTDIRRIQEIMFASLREAATHVAPTIEGASILQVVFGEALAAIMTEIAARGETLRQPGGVEIVVRACVDPLEKMLRQNIADYLAKEHLETRQ